MSKKNEVVNIESTKSVIEKGDELSLSQVINAYLANHAVEHYCNATGSDYSDVASILESCTKEDGVYWLFTCPAIDGKKSDGTPLPTKEEWKKQNDGAVEIGLINGKTWFKRPFVIGDARGVRSIVAAYGNFTDAKENAKKREADKIAAAAAVLGVSVDALLALKK